jgi:putative lipoic acid-binding regulatory protein
MVEDKPFPKEITFKAVYRTEANPKEKVSACLTEKKLSHSLSERPSAKGNFVSFTVTAEFESDDHLDQTCHSLKCVKGFMMMV